MRILSIISCLILLLPGGIHGKGNTGKTVLLPVDKYNTFSIENIYISPQEGQTPLIAFYGEDERHIFIYHTGKKKVTGFEFEASDSIMTTSSVSFVAFCWDRKKYGRFAAIFSTGGKSLAFLGDFHGSKHLKKIKLPVKSKGFNYDNGIIYYIDLGSGQVERVPKKWGFLSPSLKPGDSKQVISDFKLVQNTGEPYFTLRNITTNDSGIYKGDGFKKMVDETDRDELYPHYSADGTILGYIQRDKTGTARVCLKIGKQQPKHSKFTFALQQNALLREYKRMFFVGKQLYYFIKEPDLKSKNMGYGLRLLSEKEDKSLPYTGSVISQEQTIIDILTNMRLECRLRKIPTVKYIIPCAYKEQTFFVFLTNPGRYKITIEKQDKNFDFPTIQAQAIVISNSLHVNFKEVR